jgi:HD-like signal output (HDOD) protein
MKLILIIAMLLFISISGCGKKDKEPKTPESALLKTQKEALDKAKQVESTLQDAAKQQRKTIDK